MAAAKYYVVKKGHNPGIYRTWAECQAQTKGFSRAIYKSFSLEQDALTYFNGKAGIETYHIDDDRYNTDGLLIFVDGSNNSERTVAGFGMVFVQNGEIVYRDYGGYHLLEGDTTANVGAELFGTAQAIRLAITQGFKAIKIGHDYQGIAAFATGDWAAENEMTRRYVSFIDKALERATLTFISVDGHTGHEWNEEADRLAKLGVKTLTGENQTDEPKEYKL